MGAKVFRLLFGCAALAVMSIKYDVTAMPMSDDEDRSVVDTSRTLATSEDYGPSISEVMTPMLSDRQTASSDRAAEAKMFSRLFLNELDSLRGGGAAASDSPFTRLLGQRRPSSQQQQQTRWAAALLGKRNSRSQSQLDQLGSKRTGDRRCLYHAVNCW